VWLQLLLSSTDTAAVPVSSSQSAILIVFRIHAHTVRPRSPIRAVCTLVVFLLVVFLWLTHSSQSHMLSDCCSHLTWTRVEEHWSTYLPMVQRKLEINARFRTLRHRSGTGKIGVWRPAWSTWIAVWCQTRYLPSQ
jgi:hypothetical protein